MPACAACNAWTRLMSKRVERSLRQNHRQHQAAQHRADQDRHESPWPASPRRRRRAGSRARNQVASVRLPVMAASPSPVAGTWCCSWSRTPAAVERGERHASIAWSSTSSREPAATRVIVRRWKLVLALCSGSGVLNGWSAESGGRRSVRDRAGQRRPAAQVAVGRRAGGRPGPHLQLLAGDVDPQLGARLDGGQAVDVVHLDVPVPGARRRDRRRGDRAGVAHELVQPQEGRVGLPRRRRHGFDLVRPSSSCCRRRR